ncbi:hypothetical protein BJY16_009118 [Actinoplanes octamycinicus]|uniref:Glycosyltransferase 2-like domain-containing protein n=1 Tax=Actinoplanes octamycinicus TaxID=135948 RepID=A0A7W7H827_9ACTN|nr:glycosyltransferase family 2 protein [Actinoplanes octamycinicus]MBB4745659.1 hypothetical protein [Actinoplanes octamycinicus]GIE56502.1 hypothetical protein Aoc01nite_19040 [Actinoplanes octamycinicus]
MSVVIPAGTAALPVLLAALPATAEVIVVAARDDDTTAAAVPPAVRVVRQTRDGVGNALACGVAESTGDVVVTLAGDGSCDPAEIPRLLQALRDGADVAQGSRFRDGGRDLSGGRFARIGARVLLWLMAVLFGCRRTDPGFGFRAFWRDVAGSVGLPRVSGIDPVRGDGAEIEPLLTVRAAANGLFVTEVPAVAYPRTTPATRPGVLPAVWALAGEHVDRRRAARGGEAESIVVLTGRTAPAASAASAAVPGVLGRTGTDTRLINAGGLGGGADRRPAGDEPGARWPATNPRGGRLPEPGVDRRQGPRRAGGSASGLSFGSPGISGGRVVGSAGASGGLSFGSAGASNGQAGGDGATARRPWRDNAGGAAAREVGAGRRRMQGRPNLRVINGEGGGGGGRTGKLRAVPRPDLNE